MVMLAWVKMLGRFGNQVCEFLLAVDQVIVVVGMALPERYPKNANAIKGVPVVIEVLNTRLSKQLERIEFQRNKGVVFGFIYSAHCGIVVANARSKK
tara:strand:+ start:610 stop:900 length:291 start_codon:yes stop_codon:yes gene_type:complete